MSKLNLSQVPHGVSNTVTNKNFKEIQDVLNNEVLKRRVSVGEDNTMHTDIDMNNNRIYNLPKPKLNHEAARYEEFKIVEEAMPHVKNIEENVKKAKESADKARQSEKNAAKSEKEAAKSAKEAAHIAVGELPHNQVVMRDEPDSHPASAISYRDGSVESALDNRTVTVVSIYDLITDGDYQCDGIQFSVASFYVDSNRGGGVFVWDGNKNKTEADGGTVIDPDSIGEFDGTSKTLSSFFDAQGTGVGKGCFIRLYEQLNVHFFGAVGDGATDDSDALQQALTVVGKMSSSLYFPQGNYVLSKTLYPYTVGTNVRSFTLFGENNSIADQRFKSVISYTGGGVAIDFRGVDNLDTVCLGFKMESLAVVGLGRVHGKTQTAIKGWNLYASMFVDCSFRDIGAGILIENYSYYNIIERVRFRNIYRFALNINTVNGNTIDRCQFDRVYTGTAVTLPDDGESANAVVIGGGSPITFKGCWFESCRRGITLTGDTTILNIDSCYFEGVIRAVAVEDANTDIIHITGTEIRQVHNASGVLLVTGSAPPSHFIVERSYLWVHNAASNVSLVSSSIPVYATLLDTERSEKMSNGNSLIVGELLRSSTTGFHSVRKVDGSAEIFGTIEVDRDFYREENGVYRGVYIPVRLPAVFKDTNYFVSVTSHTTGIFPGTVNVTSERDIQMTPISHTLINEAIPVTLSFRAVGMWR